MESNASVDDASGVTYGNGAGAGATSTVTEDSRTTGLMVLFMIVGLNFMFGRLKDFSCETQAMLKDNLWARHAFNLAGVYFVLVLFTRTRPLVAPPVLAGIAVALYACFLVICRCDSRFLVAFIVLLVALFYVESELAWRRRDREPGAAEQSSPAQLGQLLSAQLALQAAAGVVAGLGFMVYLGQHWREYGGGKASWSWTTFYFGSNECHGNGSGRPKTVKRDLLDAVDAVGTTVFQRQAGGPRRRRAGRA